MNLAQINVGRLRHPPESPHVAAFIDALEPINVLADQAPGFVWRYEAPDPGEVIQAGTPDPLFIVNMSVWQDFAQLHAYVYRTEHVQYLRRRREWFQVLGGVVTALWWVDDGHRPSIAEGLDRLADLERLGPTPAAFSLRTRFTAAGAPDDGGSSPRGG